MNIALRNIAIILMLSIFVSGCSSTMAKKGYLKTQSVAFKELETITQPVGDPIIIAVYDFNDMSGQKKPGGNYASMSSAVTQGSYQILIKALQDAGQGKWFRVVERHSLASLLQERKLIRTTRQISDGEQAESLPALLFAGAYVTGGIVGYDSDVMSGGAGARVLGLQAHKEYRQDILSIMLRLINVQTGEVIISTTIEKTIYSTSTGADVFKYFDADTMLVEIEVGYSKNEPVTFAVRKAIEAGVVSLIKQGAELELWKFGLTTEEMSLEAEKKMTEELDKLDKEAKEKLNAKEESKELIKLEKLEEEQKKLNNELLKEESTDEKDNKVSANPDSNNVHG
jgi:curli production assembly/transport component CsgG